MLASTLSLSPLNAPRHPHIMRLRGEYIVCTYVLGACIKRDHYPTIGKAKIRITEIRSGVAL